MEEQTRAKFNRSICGFCSDCGGRLALFRDGNRRRFAVCVHCNFVWELPGNAAFADITIAADVPLEQCLSAESPILE